jgi:mono/diheme cytochrome c family protein
MRHVLPLLALFAAASITPALAQNTPSEKNGKAIYDKWCTPCHGAESPKMGEFGARALPGTAALALKYDGKVPAVLDQRTDLTPAFIKTIVRRGLYGMPITRKTEISDAELDDVVAYLTRNRKP